MRFVRMAIGIPGSLLLGRPYSCNLKVTERCNLRCSFCGLWKIGNRQSEMSTSEHRRLGRDLARLGLARIVVTGGEPLLRPDLVEIVRGYARHGPSVTLLTNGQLLTRELAHDLRRAGLQDLGVSVDTLDAEAQDRRCGGRGVLERALRALELGVEAFPRGIVEMLVTVTPENLSEVPILVEKAAEIGVGIVVNPVNVPGEQAEERILSRPMQPSAWTGFDPQEVDRIYDRLRQQKRAGLPVLVSNRFLRDSRWYLKTGDHSWRCDAGRLYFTVFSDGRLAPCSDLPALLSVRDPGWVKEFRGRAYRRRAREAADACSGCIFSCWREISYLVRQPATLAERIPCALSMLRRRDR